LPFYATLQLIYAICHKKGGKKMKKLLIVSMAMIILLSSSIGFSQELVDMDKDNKIFYISENAWYELPMTGPASNTTIETNKSSPRVAS
jgi:hypothetical protein